MEGFDREKALRVWQRVRGVPEETRIAPLAEEELTDAAMLLSLSRRFPGPWGRRLQTMARQDREHAARLKGLLALTRGTSPGLRAGALPVERTESLLRRCLERKQRRTELYGAMRENPEFGSLWETLAVREGEHCLALLELLGAMHQPASPGNSPRNGRRQRRRQ